MKIYVSGTQKSSIFEVWRAPGAPETTPKGGARSAPPFGRVFGAPGAVQTSKSYVLWVPGKYGSYDYIHTKFGLFVFTRFRTGSGRPESFALDQQKQRLSPGFGSAAGRPEASLRLSVYAGRWHFKLFKGAVWGAAAPPGLLPYPGGSFSQAPRWRAASPRAPRLLLTNTPKEASGQLILLYVTQ